LDSHPWFDAHPWFDSHCHLQDYYLADHGEDEATLGHVLERAQKAGVGRMVCVGTDPATSAEALELARSTRTGGWQPEMPAVWATIGLHPHDASMGTAEVEEMLGATTAGGEDTLVAVGECGLDYHYEHSPRHVQRAVFARQIELAHAHRLALVVHSREAWDDLFDVLLAEGVPERSILHCFTGGPDEVRRCLDAGMFVSFSGIVTFKNASAVREAVAVCPLDRLLVETDSPFLAPVPHRGRPNEPALVPLVGQAVAAVKGVDVAEVATSSAAVATMVFHH